MKPGEDQVSLLLYAAFGLPLAATLAWIVLYFMKPRPYVPHPDELADEDDDQSPLSSLSESSSMPAGGSDTVAPGTGESGPKG
jgi:hypothetical protein